jgi:hypothetical protein
MNPSGDGGDTVSNNAADIYLFLFGTDYRGAVAALNTLSGQ